MSELPSIHELMGRVLGELPAIGKNSYNEQQKFHFRGIDDVMNALNPLLASYGVFFLPHVLERIDSERSTRSGGTLYVVNLHVQYTFYGPAGDSVTASGWGEGTDSGDKATNKAMTGAMKYVLFQTFAISTQEAAEADSDHTVDEQTTGGRAAQHAPLAEQTVPAAVATRLTKRMNDLPAELRGRCKAEFAEQFGKPAELRRGQSETAEALVAGYEVAANQPLEAAEAPADAPSTPAPPADRMSEHTNRRLFAVMAKAGVTDANRKPWAEGILERPVPTFRTLTEADGQTLIKAADKGAAVTA